MRNRSRGARFASALAALMPATLQPGVIPAAHGAEAYQAAHTADGKPNLKMVFGRLSTQQTGTSRNMQRGRDW